MVNIITDSTSDLGADIVAEYKVTVIPLSVMIGGKVNQDGVDLFQNDLFTLVERHEELPKMAATSVGEFKEAFDRPGESVFIGISSKLSTIFQNACLALEMLPAGKVRVVDSLNLSTGLAYWLCALPNYATRVFHQGKLSINSCLCWAKCAVHL